VGKVTVKKGARAALLLPTVAKADNVDDPIRYAAVVLTDRLRDQVRTRRAAFLKARQADAALWYHEYRDEACVWLGADPFDAVDDKAAAVFDFVGGRLDARPGAVVAARLPAGLDLLAAELGARFTRRVAASRRPLATHPNVPWLMSIRYQLHAGCPPAPR
jgi:hypothetical protein